MCVCVCTLWDVEEVDPLLMTHFNYRGNSVFGRGAWRVAGCNCVPIPLFSFNYRFTLCIDWESEGCRFSRSIRKRNKKAEAP